MFDINTSLPDFWLVYVSVFWIFVGISTTPIIFRVKGQNYLLGIAIGLLAGILTAAAFVAMFAFGDALLDAVGAESALGTLLGVLVANGLAFAALFAFWRFVPAVTVANRATQGGPSQAVNYSTRVDKVAPSWLIGKSMRASLALMLALLTLIPVVWMSMTAFKSRSDAVASPPKVVFDPTMEGFIGLLTKRRQLTDQQIEEYKQRDDLNWADEVMLERGQAIIGQSDYVKRLTNSLIIGIASTITSVGMGLLAAYAFSRFKIPGEGDLLFFILSTRMLPPVVVTIPIFLMYRELGLYDTHVGMVILYTAFNLSFSVWLLKGFIDEIPREYEEAALVDGYTRMQAFVKIVLPQAVTGIAATTVFCFIFAWNEYAFALMLTADNARTAPPSIPSVLGTGGIEWATIAAGSLGFLIPVVIVTFVLRKYLLRGVTFGAIRQG
nr:carbohydrate ABC transporter permease [Aggregatilinea lenta]